MSRRHYMTRDLADLEEWIAWRYARWCGQGDEDAFKQMKIGDPDPALDHSRCDRVLYTNDKRPKPHVVLAFEAKTCGYDFGFKGERGWIVAKAKVEALLAVEKSLGVKVYFVVEFSCTTLAILDPHESYKEELGGRYDRGDRQDQEIMARFRWHQFRICEGA